MKALNDSDACVLVLPCNRSAHLELGWAVSAGKETAIYIPTQESFEPELMYKMCDSIHTDLGHMIDWLKGLE